MANGAPRPPATAAVAATLLMVVALVAPAGAGTPAHGDTSTLQLTTVHAFVGSDGNGPTHLVAANGTYYGTTTVGATKQGEVFRLEANGSVSVVHDLTPREGAEVVKLLPVAPGTFLGIARRGGGTGCKNQFGRAVGCGTIFRLNPDGSVNVLHRFTGGGDGATPTDLLLADDGNFYGTDSAGANPACFNGCGVVYRLTPAGQFSVLYAATFEDGEEPNSLVQATNHDLYVTAYNDVFRLGLDGTYTLVKQFLYGDGNGVKNILQAGDGNFYLTVDSDPQGSGRIDRMYPGGRLRVLHQFEFTDGDAPYTLELAADGTMYGTAFNGGLSGAGVVYEVTTSGSVTFPYAFTGAFDGAEPTSVLEAADGSLYGTTKVSGGGIAQACSQRDWLIGCGTVFHLFTPSPGAPTVSTFDPASGHAGERVVVTGTGFTGTSSVAFGGIAARFHVDGDTQITAVVPVGAQTGQIVVTTGSGAGASPSPFVTGLLRFSTVHTFCLGSDYPDCPDGADPRNLVQGPGGDLLGTTTFTAFQMTEDGAFDTLTKRLWDPNPLTVGQDGKIYGTNFLGGWFGPSPCNDEENPEGCGTVFRLDHSSYTDFVVFLGLQDGGWPQTGLVPVGNGRLAGTASGFGPTGHGEIFEVDQQGQARVREGFDGTNGSEPTTLIGGGDGFLYGTTTGGGANGAGVVFRYGANGIEALHSFAAAGAEGLEPNSLVRAADGTLYGTLDKGGIGCSIIGTGTSGCGTAFSLSPGGQFTMLHEFAGGNDGSHPVAVTLGQDGNVYGVAQEAGAFKGGTLFRITPAGDFSVLYPFYGLVGSTDGYAPTSLIAASDGSFWGTTTEDPSSCFYQRGCGTVFHLRP